MNNKRGSSIHIENSDMTALIHNKRVFDIPHAIDTKLKNEYFSYGKITDFVEKAKKDYKKNNKKNRSLPKNTKLIKEAIVNLEKEHNIDDLKRLCDMLKKKYGYEPMDIAIHRDEGYINQKTNEKHYNYHAHIMLLNYNFETHRTIRPTKTTLSRLQTDVAKVLKMKRGRVSDKKHAEELGVKRQKAVTRLDSFEFKKFKFIEHKMKNLQDIIFTKNKELIEIKNEVEKEKEKRTEKEFENFSLMLENNKLKTKIKDYENEINNLKKEIEKIKEERKEQNIQELNKIQYEIEKQDNTIIEQENIINILKKENEKMKKILKEKLNIKNIDFDL